MADGFTKALAKANWTVPASLHQTRIYSEVVAERPKPVAYFLVDAMRFEMGVELAERLPKTAEVARAPRRRRAAEHHADRHGGAPARRVGELQRRRAGRQARRAHRGRIPARPRRAEEVRGRAGAEAGRHRARRAARACQPSKLAKKIEGAQVVVVRSQEIDHAGEAGFTFQARQVMDTVIDNLARGDPQAGGSRRRALGRHRPTTVICSSRPTGTSRCGSTRRAATRSSCTAAAGSVAAARRRQAASASPRRRLATHSDLDFVFPSGCGVFKAGGDLAFHHGGPSLQELVIPVLTVRTEGRGTRRARPAGPITATGLPDAVTNRIFSVTLQLGGQNLSLFSSAMVVRPLLMSAGKQVGAVGMAIDAELDRATGCVTLQPGKPVTVAFLLSDESAASLRVVVQDPTTDAELYRSPTDIPVRLGV